VSNHASLHLHVALIAAALGFGLIGGPVAVVAKVIAVMFFARFVFALLGGAKPTIWTESTAWPSQLFSRHKSSSSLPHEKQ